MALLLLEVWPVLLGYPLVPGLLLPILVVVLVPASEGFQRGSIGPLEQHQVHRLQCLWLNHQRCCHVQHLLLLNYTLFVIASTGFLYLRGCRIEALAFADISHLDTAFL